MNLTRLTGPLAGALLAACLSGPAFAQTAPAAPTTPAVPAAKAPGAKAMAVVKVGFLRTYERTLALSVLDIPPADIGIAGADVAIADNNTTGSFMGQSFALDVATLKPGEDVMPAVQKMAAEGVHYIVTDLSAEDTLKVADAVKGSGALVLNAGATDDSLREENCRANMLHTAPTRSMLTDGLAQYLMWKQWRNWVLITGSHDKDKLFAEAMKASAKKFGGTILEERIFEDKGGARATDSGQALVQRQIPVFLQGLPEHDVVLVADESEVFGSYIPWRTWVPRPVAGTAGLIPASWHPASEQWGGAQIQNRFEKASGRRMQAKDMQVWTAIRILGEAASRTQSVDPATIDAFIKGKDFTVAAFKGQRLTFRDWNWQLRQPVLLGDETSVVSASPQEGFLHQASELDTLGTDRPETRCAF
ncbi:MULTISPECIES: ABC transporter substrate-binding protein [unclassified Aureimonas]|uniref:ABC transporter substrate-binding protein n=1 Tax=unclassified Aureimonas TaxID=2615206 RepID=UPI000700957F|nr:MULTISPECIES: ABC transporter substrate-binding protein [unclassified Aureimonas]KQT70004.1 branched-chain amino acid ABC transporter substrate-binding protein [Aureimonas sp. Leaf427]KQT75841.1 branched-chain amino acid ABC transporter substrate-binding protein [Aureimonas sp. Leaf460]